MAIGKQRLSGVDKKIVDMRKQMYPVDAIAEVIGLDIEYTRQRVKELDALYSDEY